MHGRRRHVLKVKCSLLLLCLNGQVRPLFIYFWSFLVTIQISIEIA